MGKPQKKKKNNNGYFARNIQQFGEDFLSKKTAKDINYEYRHIFKDIAFSEPEEVAKYAVYFMNYNFVYNLSQCAFNEWSTNNATFLGLQTYVQVTQMSGGIVDPKMRLNENMLKAQQLTDAYGIISSNLNNILSLFGVSVDNEYLKMNVEATLKLLSAQLSKYRRLI